MEGTPGGSGHQGFRGKDCLINHPAVTVSTGFVGQIWTKVPAGRPGRQVVVRSRGHTHAMAKVGLCEDDPAIRRVVSEGLRLHGHETVVAYDGGEALRRFADDTTLEVLILDIGLPDADGRDVCVALRSAGQVAP